MKYTVLLSDQTVGQLYSDIEPEIGTRVTVELRDENGNPVKVAGTVEDILEESDC